MCDMTSDIFSSFFYSNSPGYSEKRKCDIPTLYRRLQIFRFAFSISFLQLIIDFLILKKKIIISFLLSLILPTSELHNTTPTSLLTPYSIHPTPPLQPPRAIPLHWSSPADRVSLSPGRRGGQAVQYKLWDTNLPGNLYSSSSDPHLFWDFLGPVPSCGYLGLR